jgi:hypothetical protein
MEERLEEAFRQKEEFLRMEEHLLREATDFFMKCFESASISPSQMAAIGGILQTSDTIESAKKEMIKWLEGQLEKLETKENRRSGGEEGGRGAGGKTSWLHSVDGASLGKVLICWIKDEKYLASDPATIFIKPVRLAALRRFWNNIYGQYCYKKIWRETMPLEKEMMS